jgi:hypothetical protein
MKKIKTTEKITLESLDKLVKKIDSLAQQMRDIQSGKAIVSPNGKIIGYRKEKK